MRKSSAGLIALSLFSAGVMGVVAAFQTGGLKHLPRIGVRAFDAEKVHGSKAAYAFFGVPDGLLGSINYVGTAALAALDRPRALAAKTALDLSAVIGFEIYAWRTLRALSAYALATGAASAASLALAAARLRKQS